MRFNKFFIILLLFSSSLYLSANTMYSLSGVKKVYPVVEIMSKEIPLKHKKIILQEVKSVLSELHIDYSGYSQRAFAIMITSIKVKNIPLITIELLIGEQVLRSGSKKKIFAATYIDKESFVLQDRDEDSIIESLEDSIDSLLSRFSDQYEEEMKIVKTIVIDNNNFASQMKYENSYENAIKKAKKNKKDIMMVLVSNYCPWCRKFERNVLQQKNVNTLLHKKYIPLILNKDKDNFPKKYNKAFSPIVYFIDYKTLKSYESVIGYNNKDDFLHLINKID